jgi:hypothetical protein
MEEIMPRAYFEPESLDALAEVFAEAKRRLNAKDINDPMTLDLVASRILALAAEGLSPWMILKEIVEQDSGGANGATHETTASSLQQNWSSSKPGSGARKNGS